ncbi:hypothetical protein COBT_000467 [Conglomerata obtusa]
MPNTNDYAISDGELKIKKSKVRKLLRRIFKSTKGQTASQASCTNSNHELIAKKTIGNMAATSKHTNHLNNPNHISNITKAIPNPINQKVNPLADIENTTTILRHSDREHNPLGNVNHTNIMPKNQIWDISTLNDHQVVFYKLKRIYITVSAFPPFKISLIPKNNDKTKAKNIDDIPKGISIALWDKNSPPDQVYCSTVFDVPEEVITEDDSIAIFNILNKYQIAKIDPSKISCNCKHCVK